MSRQEHPDTEALASFRAGLTGGFRGRRLAAHIADCARCASVSDQLGEVSSILASVPAPALPEAFESRITAALAAETAAREAAAGTSPAAAGSAARDAAERVAPAARPRPAPARRRQPGFRFHPAMAYVPVIALLLAGFGYLLSRPGASSSSSSMLSEGVASPVPAAAPASASARPAALSPGFSSARFVVIASGTNYEAATLRAQVLGQLAAQSAGTAPVTSAVPSAAASSPMASAGENSAGGSNGIATSVSAALNGCALSLTGNVTPSFVDRATYDGKPVYVIAVPDHAWVVGRGCTAGNHYLIASIALTGAP
jgi:hypothetical protein